MYKILFITLIVLSVSIRAHPEAETGVVELNAAPKNKPVLVKPKAGLVKPNNANPKAGANANPAVVKPKAAKPKAAKPKANPAGAIPKAGPNANPAVKPKAAKPKAPTPINPGSPKSGNKVGPKVTPKSSQKSSSARKCHNRFDYNGFQVDVNCVVCKNGTHESKGKCVSNATGCTKKTLVQRTNKAKATIGGNCVKCNFWQWQTVSDAQGNYCVNRWWMWVIIFTSGIIGLSLLVSAIAFFACCDDMCSKKQSKKSSKGKGGEVNVQNKKPEEKKAKKQESYDKGYSKPGFCDCMCLANSCGPCFRSCGCTCSKCCKKQGSFVSGYNSSDKY